MDQILPFAFGFKVNPPTLGVGGELYLFSNNPFKYKCMSRFMSVFNRLILDQTLNGTDDKTHTIIYLCLSIKIYKLALLLPLITIFY